MIRRLRRALYARRSVQVFKHALETRSDLTEIRSHNGIPHEAGAVSTSEELLESIKPETDVVAVEEAQFFDEGIVDACRSLADSGYEVIVAGLDMDFRGRPFGPMPSLLAEADEVVKLRAICAICGRDASRSQRLIDGKPAPASARPSSSARRRPTRPAAASTTRCEVARSGLYKALACQHFGLRAGSGGGSAGPAPGYKGAWKR